ncbi:MAG: hldE [Chlamydiia bacterium]|nr:hldE [Chlamydiia bacterium]
MVRRLAPAFGKIKPKRVLVAGDFMLDRYVFGSSKRISPEAPVPVLLVGHEEERAGGAGNVVLNLQSLGMEVTALGRIGADFSGTCLKQCIPSEYLYSQANYQTPEKVRVIASNQQIVRIDYERVKDNPLDVELEARILDAMDALVKEHDVITVSDYGKGFLTDPILLALLTTAKKYNIPTIVDPKGAEFAKYQGATILKPNLSEAYAAAGFAGMEEKKTLQEVAGRIFEKVAVDVLMITRSESGISLFYPDGRFEDHPVHAQAIRDVTGAGDTVLAVLSSAVANGISLGEGTQLANVAASIAVMRVGCAQVTLSEIAHKLIEGHSGDKIFTEEHLSAFEHAMKGKNSTLLRLHKDCEVSVDLLRAVRELAKDKKKELIVSVSASSINEELVRVLASLQDVNYIHMSVGDALFFDPTHIYEFTGSELRKV